MEIYLGVSFAHVCTSITAPEFGDDFITPGTDTGAGHDQAEHIALTILNIYDSVVVPVASAKQII